MASSGIDELDQLLGGGYPIPSAILFEGPIESAKESILYEFVSSATGSECCVFVTKSEVTEVVNDAKGIGIDFRKDIIWVAGEGGKAKSDLENLATFSRSLKDVLDANKGRGMRIVFDIISPMLMTNSSENVYRFVDQLISEIKKYDAVMLATLDDRMHPQQVITSIEHTFDGVISVGAAQGSGAPPSLRIKRMKGASDVVGKELFATTSVKPQVERRLAAIMFTDMVGYTALGQRNESLSLVLVEEQRKIIRPILVKHNGREVKTIGDAFLVEFPNAVDAVRCAYDIQRAVREFNFSLEPEKRIHLRVGVHVGEVVESPGDISGDAVNVASRIEPLAEDGGVCITYRVYDLVHTKVDLQLSPLGPRSLKNVAEPMQVYKVVMPWAGVTPAVAPTGTLSASQLIGSMGAPTQYPSEVQKINFCAAHDGARIAYAVTGEGSPLVKTATWLSHLEFDFESPLWRHWITELSRYNSYIRYDERGCGLSDQNPPEFSFNAWVSDLETVVDSLEIDKFDLLGISQGGAVAIDYAVRHPERVKHLILYGAFARGWSKGVGPETSPKELETRKAMESMSKLIEFGWGQDNPVFRQVFTSMFVPEGGLEQQRWFNELQRVSCSPQNAARFYEIFMQIDVASLLPQVSVPTLIMHARQDGVTPFEAGRLLASRIPGARFVSFEGRNHILLETEPGWQTFLRELRQFMAAPSK